MGIHTLSSGLSGSMSDMLAFNLGVFQICACSNHVGRKERSRPIEVSKSLLARSKVSKSALARLEWRKSAVARMEVSERPFARMEGSNNALRRMGVSKRALPRMEVPLERICKMDTGSMSDSRPR